MSADTTIRETGIRVIVREAMALSALAESMPADFTASVDLILGAPGRVIVAGVGKSGHIARKIAATLSSTGTPAMFLHPTEASHGDLGAIVRGDVCLILSSSGDSAELGDLLAYCREQEIPIIGISRNPASNLMTAATARLTVPDLPEACALGMAPTVSTALALGMGDALAVALMEQRGFSTDGFRAYHPGGRLGASLSTVGQLMHGVSALATVGEKTPMKEVILRMSECGFGIAAVTNEQGALVGVISDGDLRRHIDNILNRTAGQVATRIPLTVAPSDRATGAMALMNECRVTALVVVNECMIPQGVIHMHDCVRAGVTMKEDTP